MREKTRELLTSLCLKGMEKTLDRELNLAEKEGTGVAEVLYRLLCEESAHRQHRSMLYRLNDAKIPYDWTLKTFPFQKQPGVQKSQIMSLASLSFIERAQNIVFIGQPGTGKTGLAIGLLRTYVRKLAHYRRSNLSCASCHRLLAALVQVATLIG